MSKVLNLDGLQYFWGKIKTFITDRIGNAKVFYGTCDTAATTGEKAVTCADFKATDLRAGSIISVYFTITNTAAVASLTLNVNGTGAKPIRYAYNGGYTTLPGTNWLRINQIHHFTYDGTYWVLQSMYNTNSVNQLNRTYAQIYAGTAGIYGHTLVMQKPDGTWESIVTSYSTGTKEANTNGFLPGIVNWYYTSATIASGNRIGTSVLNSAYPIGDTRYTFNGITTSASTSAQVAGKSVYLVGTIVNGLFYLDTTNWFSQTLPTSADGKVYIYLGEAYDCYRMDFMPEHAMYAYLNGHLREIKPEALLVNGHTVNADVPSGAKFTDTTYTPASANPLMDGTAAVGTSAKYAREDHVHPTDTSRAPTSHASTADTYGVGTGNKYGHVKLITSTSTLLTEDDGYAATPSAVGSALNEAKSYADSVAGEVNQNAFSNVKVGSTTIASGAKTATLELVAGTNVTLTPDATNKKVTINATSGGTVTPDLDLGAKDLTSTSLASATQKTIGASITVPAGKWIITVCVRFNSNATGQRAAWLSTSNNGNAAVVAATSRVAAVSGGQTFVHFSYPCSLTANTTYYVVGYQDSGASINALGYARWLGVAD